MSAARGVERIEVPIDATVTVPGSKSFTNRALVAAALAEGTSELEGVLLADDSETMIGALRPLGVGIDVDRAARRARVRGPGARLPADPVDLEARLSATTARFLLPVLALGPGPCRLDGGLPLRMRPMGPTVDALRALGAEVHDEGRSGHLPVTVAGGALRGGIVAVAGDRSSQHLSGLLLAAPAMADGLRVELTSELVSRPYLDVTEAVMAAFGVAVERPNDRTYAVAPAPYRPAAYEVEPDASSASYFFAAAAICGGRVRVEGLGRGSVQGDLRFVDVLEQMGACVKRSERWTEVEGTGALHGVDVDLTELPDVALTLAAVAVFADGPTRVRGVGFIRDHETDRIAAVVAELGRSGIEAHEEPDGFVVHPGVPRPAVIETYDDHRVAMSFALLGLRAPGIEIADPGVVAKTFPHYFEVLDSLRHRRVGG